MSRNLRTLALVSLAAAWLSAVLALHAPVTAAAQTCDEEDAGDEDAGGDEDGGLACEPLDSGTPPIGEPDASLPDAGGEVDAGGGAYPGCSCETAEGTGAGTIHVCTGAREADVCRSFECESGSVRDRPCPTRAATLCCEMYARGLYSQLYDDCDHPNCETGFRAQCFDFGGTITEGPCVIEEPGEDLDDDSSGGCTVQPLRSARGDAALLWLLGIALVLVARTKR